jgi:hypothetical protein
MNQSSPKNLQILNFIFFWFLIALCLIGVFLVLFSTTWGAALSDDSYYYISSARNLLAGNGFDLVPNFPPLLPLLLGLIGIFKVDPLISIRWLNALLIGLNIFLVAQIILALTKSVIFSLIGASFTLVSATLIMVHSWAMSEALFISLVLLGIFFYATGYSNTSWKIPFLTGLFFGLAAATRYVGIAFLLAGGIFWLFEPAKGFRQRLGNTLIFSSVGILPLLLWTIRNQFLIGQPTNRVFAQHPMTLSLWIKIVNTILLWILPGRLVNGKEIYWLGVITILVTIMMIFYLLRWSNRTRLNGSQPNDWKPIVFICLCILSYLVILILSRSYFDIRIPMDERLLSPILVMGLILLVWILARMWGYHHWFTYAIVIVSSLTFVFTNFTRSAGMVNSYHETGRGYASARDHISETYAYLRNRPDIPVFSNAFAGIYFWTGRVTQSIPPTNQIQAMKDEMKKSGAYLVLFDSIPVELYGMNREELTSGLVEQIRLSEATIYRAP